MYARVPFPAAQRLDVAQWNGESEAPGPQLDPAWNGDGAVKEVAAQTGVCVENQCCPYAGARLQLPRRWSSEHFRGCIGALRYCARTEDTTGR